jgi:pyridoxal phosphate enzyme (YggS family)
MNAQATAVRLEAVRQRICAAERRFGRTPGSVTLLAVGKGHPASALQAAVQAGQRRFGENYLQEALPKLAALAGWEIEWHFIGPLQSNKTRGIASHFHWVHSLDSARMAQRLSDQRPAELAPLQVCIQVNISREPTKSGVLVEHLAPLADVVMKLPRLKLRGLMAIPAPQANWPAQRQPFREVRLALADLQRAQGPTLDTLSIGMSGDLEAAIAEGATLVRVGTAIFGPRVRSW